MAKKKPPANSRKPKSKAKPSPIPISKTSLQLAIKNIAEYGDTDVFPFPLENHWFFDEPSAVEAQLERLRCLGIDVFDQYPVFATTELCNVGYAGFRPATQIDPLWNALFLAAVIEIAPQIEGKRQSIERVFSYRFCPDPANGSLFAKHGWKEYQLAALKLADSFSYVASVDISDFYPRIYHHRLENALRTDCGCDGTIVKFIDKFLSQINAERSFGLPAGGPASRILAESLLVRTDRLMETSQIPFLRFVDDYYLFGDSEDRVRSAVLRLNRLLLDNEGLSLNRNKTRLLTNSELKAQSIFNTEERSESADEKEKRRFFSLRLQFDPYSPTAAEDYDALSHAIGQFDVLSLIENEIRKSRVDRFAVNQLVKAIRFMEEPQKSAAIQTLALNLGTLAPVFPIIAVTFRQIRQDVSSEACSKFHEAVRKLVASRSPLIAASGTLAFAIRVLADDPDPDADIALDAVFSSASELTPILQREVVLAMVKIKSTYWLSNLRNKMVTVTSPWTRRAMLAGSYVLRDEGKHWRDVEKGKLQEHDKAFLAWLATKHGGGYWEIPL